MWTWDSTNDLAIFPLYLILALPRVLTLRWLRTAPRGWAEAVARVLALSVPLAWSLDGIDRSLLDLVQHEAPEEARSWLGRAFGHSGLSLGLIVACAVARCCRQDAEDGPVSAPVIEGIEGSPPDVVQGS